MTIKDVFYSAEREKPREQVEGVLCSCAHASICLISGHVCFRKNDFKASASPHPPALIAGGLLLLYAARLLICLEYCLCEGGQAVLIRCLQAQHSKVSLPVRFENSCTSLRERTAVNLKRSNP